MNFEQRSYSGKLFRPRPEVHVETDGQLIIVATPWGPRSSAQTAIQTIQDLMLSAREDMEVTSPFDKLTCLSPSGNNLRAAVRLANDGIYQEENRQELTSGIEMFAATRSLTELTWTQVGLPHVLLDRAGFDLLPLGGQVDLSLAFSSQPGQLPPLPGNLLGLASSSNFRIERIPLRVPSRLILISRSTVPKELFQLKSSERTLDNMTSALSAVSPDEPFWIGRFEL